MTPSIIWASASTSSMQEEMQLGTWRPDPLYPFKIIILYTYIHIFVPICSLSCYVSVSYVSVFSWCFQAAILLVVWGLHGCASVQAIYCTYDHVIQWCISTYLSQKLLIVSRHQNYTNQTMNAREWFRFVRALVLDATIFWQDQC